MEYSRSPEALPANLRFISVEEIEQMRHEQEALVQEAGVFSLEGKEAMDIALSGKDYLEAAFQQKKQEIDQAVELYVADHLNRDDNPELFDGCVELIRRYSVLNMTDEKWRSGDKDADGNYTNPETSGQYLLKEELRALTEPEPDSIDPDLDPAVAPELGILQNNLESTRKRLAEVSLKRRAMMRKKGKKADALRTEYEAAQAEYNQAYIAMGAASVDLLRLSGESEDAIAERVKAGTIYERSMMTSAEREVMEADNSKMAKFLRSYSKLPVMFGVNAFFGGSIGYAAGKAIKYGFIAAVPVAGVAGLAAVRAGKSLLTTSATNRVRLHKEFEKRAMQDAQALRAEIESPETVVQSGQGGDYYAQLSQQFLQKSVDTRVEKDIKGNRKRAALSATIAGGATVLGSLIASGDLKSPFAQRSHPLSFEDKLKNAGVDSKTRADILANPDAFKHMVDNPEDFEKFMNGVEKVKQTTHLTGTALEDRVHKTLGLADYIDHHPTTGATTGSSGALHSLPVIGDNVTQAPTVAESLTTSASFNVPRGGGVIKSIIRPLAENQGVKLDSSRETALWQAVKSRFGNDLFVNNSVFSKGSDQLIANTGNTQLRPEVASFIKAKIAEIV